jgi:hypothetical protein
MTTLYNCHHDGDQYRITKFIDGNPESSYLTTHRECDCPAGSRPTCRHRQMLPEFLERDLVNSHLFIAWDLPHRPTCEFDGGAPLGLPFPAPRSTPGPDQPLRFNKDYSNSVGHSPAYDTIPQSRAPFRRRL